MLTVTREGNIITVKGYMPSRVDGQTVRYNLDNWTVQVNNGPWRPMDATDIHWVLKRYPNK